jgi:hypothetical protein
MIQKVDIERITDRVQGVVLESLKGGDVKGQEKPIAVVAKEALAIIRRFQRTDKTNRKVLISEDAIKSVFHLPISKAASELGVGLTVRKKTFFSVSGKQFLFEGGRESQHHSS